MAFLHRLAAVLMSVAIAAGSGAVCAGWALTPEARMACCMDDDTCPMHAGKSIASAHSAMTQADADECCGAAEQKSSSPSAPTLVLPISAAVLGTGIVVPAAIPALVLTDSWRTAAPLPTTSVPRHVLLSVFLV